MLVFVLNRHGRPFMPCHPAKARQLLQLGKAKVLRRTPFTIRLLYGSSGYKQRIGLGGDSGYAYIGLSAVSPKKELFASYVQLRTDMVKLNSERKQYRRFRRCRKTWYRKPRFLNRKKPEGWLPPSLRNKVDAHIKAVTMLAKILPVTNVTVEVASFDIQKIKDPSVSGIDYQNGPQKDFPNVREYVLYRDGHKCVHCKGKSGDKRLEVHHLLSRQTAGNRPDIFATLCSTCHELVSQSELALHIKPSGGLKAETFMSTVRWIIVNRLKDLAYSVSHTYGYLTKVARQRIGLAKSHINDAFVIAGGTTQRRSSTSYLIQQVRRSNRKLFKGDRSHIKNTAPRFISGFQRFDKVFWKGSESFIFGRRSTGYFDLRKLDGTKIHASVKAAEISLLERAQSFLIERTRIPLYPNVSVQDGVSCAR